jgi:hypothetical protein
MSRGLIVTAVVGTALAFAAGAHAKYILKGEFKTDPNASIQLVVIPNKDGKPKRIASVRYAGVDAYCPDGTVTEVSATTSGGKVKKQSRGQRTFSAGGPDSDPPVNIFGRINGRGTKARGDLFLVGDPATTCLNGPGPSGALLPFRAEK